MSMKCVASDGAVFPIKHQTMRVVKRGSQPSFYANHTIIFFMELNTHQRISSQLLSSVVLNEFAVALTVESCTSHQWSKIGRAIAAAPYLRSLEILHCNTGDAICSLLCQSKSIRQLRIGTATVKGEQCGITPIGVEHISRMEHLEELILGNLGYIVDEPAANTRDAYETIFAKLLRLRTLRMPGPSIEEINVSKTRIDADGSRISDDRCRLIA